MLGPAQNSLFSRPAAANHGLGQEDESGLNHVNWKHTHRGTLEVLNESDAVQAQHLFSDSGGADVDNVPIQRQTGRALFAPTMPQPQVPQEAYQRMLRLLTRMMNEHLEKDLGPRALTEVGDE